MFIVLGKMKSCVKDRLLAPFLPSPPRCCCFPFLEAFFLAPPCVRFGSLRGRVSVVSWGSVHSFLCFARSARLPLLVDTTFACYSGAFLCHYRLLFGLGFKVLLSCSFSAGKVVNQSPLLSLSLTLTLLLPHKGVSLLKRRLLKSIWR